MTNKLFISKSLTSILDENNAEFNLEHLIDAQTSSSKKTNAAAASQTKHA